MKEPQTLNRIFFALSDATRRDLLTRLLPAEATIGELAENYEMSLPAISKHIQVLEDAQLVMIKRVGRTKKVSIFTETLETAQIWLTTLNDESVIYDRIEQEIEALLEASDD